MEISKTCRNNLIVIATAYAKATGSSIGAVSKQFYGNHSFLAEFKAGAKSCSLDKFDEMVNAFRARWPDGVEWPSTRAAIIPRPKPAGRNIPRQVRAAL